MSRGAPWAATSVPEIRRHWCNALDSTAQNHSTALQAPADTTSAQSKKLQTMQAKLAETIDIMRTEARALREAELYWVARDMVDVTMDAATVLPEWTPMLAAPAPNGLLCWAKPAGKVRYGAVMGHHALDVPWDSVWWWTRPDGVMQLTPASRLSKNQELLKPFGVTSPLWAAHTIVLDPKAPRTDEVLGSPEAYEFVSIVGAAWLLMGQPAVADSRTIDTAPSAPSRPPGGVAPPPRTPSTVTIIELRRPATNPESAQGKSDREFQRRWWVGGHWRQQVCGPGRSQRRPTWIAPYVKGPEGAPLTKDRVHVLRR